MSTDRRSTTDRDPLPPESQPLAVDVEAEGLRIALSRRRVAEVARTVLRSQGVPQALLSITFVTDQEIARLNGEHLGHEGPTDVISFALAVPLPRSPVVGDIYIAPSVVRSHAVERGRPIREELTRVVVHGVLHVLGHDHPEDGDREHSPMWLLQERLVDELLSPPQR